jgi:hypothetical protein
MKGARGRGRGRLAAGRERAGEGVPNLTNVGWELIIHIKRYYCLMSSKIVQYTLNTIIFNTATVCCQHIYRVPPKAWPHFDSIAIPANTYSWNETNTSQ